MGNSQFLLSPEFDLHLYFSRHLIYKSTVFSTYYYTKIQEIQKKLNFAQKRGVRVAISQKGHLGISQNVHQIEAFRPPGYEELSEFTGMDLTIEMNCAVSTPQIELPSPILEKYASFTDIHCGVDRRLCMLGHINDPKRFSATRLNIMSFVPHGPDGHHHSNKHYFEY